MGRKRVERSSTEDLPPEVRVRIVGHMADRAMIRTAAVLGVPGGYEMTSDREGPGQDQRFEKALRTAERAFPGGEVTADRPPVDDNDSGWSVSFRFQRGREAARWDAHLFEVGNVLFRAIDLRERGTLASANPFATRGMSLAAATLEEALVATGDPVFSVARNLLASMYLQTPPGAGRNIHVVPDGRTETVEGVREVVRKTAATLLEMLDSGTLPGSPRPERPQDEEGRREYAALWWARTACLTALAVKEDGTVSKVGEGFTRDMVQAVRVMRALAADSGDVALHRGVAAMSSVLAETPFGRRWSDQKGETFPEIDVADAERNLRGAAAALHEEILHRFPAPEPAYARGPRR